MPTKVKDTGSAVLWFIACGLIVVRAFAASQAEWPTFGRDTVLVWNIQNQQYSSELVVRIAEFSPNRFLEWEDGVTQGTILIPDQAVREAKGFSTNLFRSGVDVRTENVITLWLCQKIFRELKEKKKVKLDIDSVPGWMSLQGTDQLAIEVNRSSMTFPVIKTLDDRGSERWFLDLEPNPLMVQHVVRKYRQTLASITTNEPNTLRWIKGKKLSSPSR
jgi:hypothetical protein